MISQVIGIQPNCSSYAYIYRYAEAKIWCCCLEASSLRPFSELPYLSMIIWAGADLITSSSAVSPGSARVHIQIPPLVFEVYIGSVFEDRSKFAVFLYVPPLPHLIPAPSFLIPEILQSQWLILSAIDPPHQILTLVRLRVWRMLWGLLPMRLLGTLQPPPVWQRSLLFHTSTKGSFFLLCPFLLGHNSASASVWNDQGHWVWVHTAVELPWVALDLRIAMRLLLTALLPILNVFSRCSARISYLAIFQIAKGI